MSSDGHLKSEYSGMGITYDSFYRFEGNALKCVLTAEKGEEPVPADDDTYNFETYKHNIYLIKSLPAIPVPVSDWCNLGTYVQNNH